MNIEILSRYGREDLAILTVARINGRVVEFAESLQPPIPRRKKWVLILSTLHGCPMGCRMCDAGEYYDGPLDAGAMLAQVDWMVRRRFPDKRVPVEKFKIQFARIGEPALNSAVLDVLRCLPDHLDAPGLIPCVSTVAPTECDPFMEKLVSIKDRLYSGGNFQLQFSIHSSSEKIRHLWMNPRIWPLEKIAAFGRNWYQPGDRKVTLNFAVTRDSVIEPQRLRLLFDPDRFLIKLTPVNPTLRARKNGLDSTGILGTMDTQLPLVTRLRGEGFTVIPSVGEEEENRIGTNCGQFATHFRDGKVRLKEGYTSADYPLQR